MNPFRYSGALIAYSMMPTTISSVTNAPLSIACFAFTPFGDPAATAARSMSPVAKWHKQ